MIGNYGTGSAAAIVHKLTTLDLERFSPEALRQRLTTTTSHDDARDAKSTTTRNTTTTTYSVAELSHRAAQRKALKNHAKALKETRLVFQKQQQHQAKEENAIAPTRVPMTTAAADEEKFREELLWTEMKVLSPTPPIYYEIQDSLNIFIANK